MDALMRLLGTLLAAGVALAEAPLALGQALPQRILAYGDSNTFGTNSSAVAQAPARHLERDRWYGVLAAGLGGGYQVLANGRIGRAIDMERGPDGAWRANPRNALLEEMRARGPFRLIIVKLGTNDVSAERRRTAEETGAAAVALAEAASREHMRAFPSAPPLAVILVAPPPFGDTSRGSFRGYFDAGIVPSRGLGAAFRAAGAAAGIPVFDAGQAIAAPGGLDGVHLSAADHRRIGQALIEPARALLDR
jgi:lysophospholipase L1-like esterase